MAFSRSVTKARVPGTVNCWTEEDEDLVSERQAWVSSQTADQPAQAFRVMDVLDIPT